MAKVTVIKDEQGRQVASIFRACALIWIDRNCDPQCENEEFFTDLKEAEKYAKDLKVQIGWASRIDEYKFNVSEFDGNLDEIELENFENEFDCLEIETVYEGETNKGDYIGMAVIIQWSYEKYVGYARNLLDIFVGSDFNLYFESDLITGNEDTTFGSNYSVLLTEKEAEESLDLETDIIEALNKGNWKWNHFKNNPLSAWVADKVENIVYDLKFLK